MQPQTVTKLTIASLEQLRSEAQRFSAELLGEMSRGGMSIGLVGELGAGKTTFVRFLAEALQCHDGVSSPTYVLCHEYRCANGLILEHWDLYRVATVPDELTTPSPKECVRLIEWVDKSPELEAEVDWKVTLKLIDQAGKRQLTIERKR